MDSISDIRFTRILAILGSVIQLGFGVWHFVVPWLYGWNNYLTSVPWELVNGINATNFFFSLLMTLVGIQALFFFVGSWDHMEIVRSELVLLIVLWIGRVGYQAISPQGTMIPGLSVGMLLIFCVTALYFIIPLLVLTRSTNGYRK